MSKIIRNSIKAALFIIMIGLAIYAIVKMTQG